MLQIWLRALPLSSKKNGWAAAGMHRNSSPTKWTKALVCLGGSHLTGSKRGVGVGLGGVYE